MTLEQTMLVISALATSVTAVMIFFTLLEMVRQRKTSYKPVIVPIRQNIFASKDPILKLEIPCNWLPKSMPEFEEGEIIPRDYFVKLYNLGNGAAKNVHIKWKFNLEDVVNEINRISQKSFQDLYIEKEGKNVLNIKTKESTVLTINLDLDLEHGYDYLLPAHIEKEGLSVRLPMSFKVLVSLHYQILAKADENGRSKFSHKPNIELSLIYNDIGGASYKSNFNIGLNLVAISGLSSESQSLEFFHAVLEC